MVAGLSHISVIYIYNIYIYIYMVDIYIIYDIYIYIIYMCERERYMHIAQQRLDQK